MKDSGKKLGLWMAMALVIGNMIGSGIFFFAFNVGRLRRN